MSCDVAGGDRAWHRVSGALLLDQVEGPAPGALSRLNWIAREEDFDFVIDVAKGDGAIWQQRAKELRCSRKKALQSAILAARPLGSLKCALQSEISPSLEANCNSQAGLLQRSQLDHDCAFLEIQQCENAIRSAYAQITRACDFAMAAAHRDFRTRDYTAWLRLNAAIEVEPGRVGIDVEPIPTSLAKERDEANCKLLLGLTKEIRRDCDLVLTLAEECFESLGTLVSALQGCQTDLANSAKGLHALCASMLTGLRRDHLELCHILQDLASANVKVGIAIDCKHQRENVQALLLSSSRTNSDARAITRPPRPASAPARQQSAHAEGCMDQSIKRSQKISNGVPNTSRPASAPTLRRNTSSMNQPSACRPSPYPNGKSSMKRPASAPTLRQRNCSQSSQADIWRPWTFKGSHVNGQGEHSVKSAPGAAHACVCPRSKNSIGKSFNTRRSKHTECVFSRTLSRPGFAAPRCGGQGLGSSLPSNLPWVARLRRP